MGKKGDIITELQHRKQFPLDTPVGIGVQSSQRYRIDCSYRGENVNSQSFSRTDFTAGVSSNDFL